MVKQQKKRKKILSREEVYEMRGRIGIATCSWDRGYLQFYPLGAPVLQKSKGLAYIETHFPLNAGEIVKLAIQYQYYVDLSDQVSKELKVENIMKFGYDKSYNLEAIAKRISAEHEELMERVFRDKGFKRGGNWGIRLEGK